jgi:hypothetical protein
MEKLYYYTNKDKKCIITGCNNLGKSKGKKNNLNQEYKCIFCESHLFAYHRKVVKKKKTQADFDNEMELFLQERKINEIR